MIGLGIIGCGNVLEAYAPQCERLRARGLANLVAACGRPQQEFRARALGVANFTTSEGEILNNAAVDVVIVLTSMPEHARLAAAALNAGKHVLLEKPLATNLLDAQMLLALAQEKQRHLVCAPFTTLSPTFQTIGQRIAAGHIGQPALARARYGWSGPWWSEWFYKPGGGCLLDLGIYCVTSLTGLLGPAKRVSAFAGVAVAEREINGRKIAVEAEDNAQVMIDFGEACFGTVMSGFTMQQYRTPALETYGSAGTVQMLGDDWDPEGYEIFQNATGCWQVYKETAPDWPWADGLRELVEALHENREPRVSKEHAYHVLEIILAAQRSAREGCAIPIQSSFERLTFAPLVANEPIHLTHDRTRRHVE